MPSEAFVRIKFRHKKAGGYPASLFFNLGIAKEKAQKRVFLLILPANTKLSQRCYGLTAKQVAVTLTAEMLVIALVTLTE